MTMKLLSVSDYKERLSNYFEEELINEIEASAELRLIPNGTGLMEIGQLITYIPIVLSGSLKVLTEDKNGEELLLYYLEEGDTCSMTLSCCNGKTKSNISAVVESESEVIFIPVEKMDEWMAKYSSWRNFILESYNDRFNEFLEAIDGLAFMNMEERLLKHLRDKVLVTKSAEIIVTHAEIARDLHSSRVVISRLMKKLEREGQIIQRRNLVELVEYK